MQSIVEQLRSSATVESVYGDPVEHGEKTVIPVARIAFGFGGGYGSSEEVAHEHEEADETETEREAEEGGGVGGGVMALPVGVVEITDEGTRFVRFGDRKRMVGGVVLGLFLGLLLGRRKRD